MLESDIKDLIVGQARMEQQLTDMNNRLFGNGQPGLIQYFAKEIEDIKDDQAKLDKDAGILAWKLGSMSAFAGAVLSLGSQWVYHLFKK